MAHPVCAAAIVGWLVVAGPRVAPGKSENPAAIVDFAPMAGAVLGVRMPGVGSDAGPR